MLMTVLKGDLAIKQSKTLIRLFKHRIKKGMNKSGKNILEVE